MAWVIAREGTRGTKYYGQYRDVNGRQRSAGSFRSRRAAERAAQRQEFKVRNGDWIDPIDGKITFEDYVQTVWLPSRHIEASTRAAYISYLNTHFLPHFGSMRIARVLPSDVQSWVGQALAGGLSANSTRKYHVVLHSIFKRAVRDRLIAFNPCESTELPKPIAPRRHTLTPDAYRRILEALPEEHRLMIETAIWTGARWGEVVALRPRHINFLHRYVTIQETIVELGKSKSPTGQRIIFKPYPKDDEPRTLGLPQELLDKLDEHIQANGLGRDDLLFPTRNGTPISRNTFRTRVWLPAVRAAGLGFHVRFHDLRHAHASWLLAGGADLKSVMDRMGHSQIQTTQKYLHALPDADDRNLDALNRIMDKHGR